MMQTITSNSTEQILPTTIKTEEDFQKYLNEQNLKFYMEHLASSFWQKKPAPKN